MKYSLFILLIVFNLPVAGQEVQSNLPSDRPGNTMNASTLQAGLWQLQTGVHFGGFINRDNGKAFENWGMPLDLRYGITNKLEIMVNGSGSFASTEGTGAGIEYSLLSYAGYLRFNLFDETPFGSMGLLGGYQHRSYEGGIAAANNFIGKLLYRLPLGEKFQFATNLGYTYTTLDRTDYTEEEGGRFDFTASFAYMLGQKFGLYVETFGSEGSENSLWIDGGIFWLPSPNLQWDLIFGNGGTDSFDQYYTTIGLCYRFGEPR